MARDPTQQGHQVALELIGLDAELPPRHADDPPTCDLEPAVARAIGLERAPALVRRAAVELDDQTPLWPDAVRPDARPADDHRHVPPRRGQVALSKERTEEILELALGAVLAEHPRGQDPAERANAAPPGIALDQRR